MAIKIGKLGILLFSLFLFNCEKESCPTKPENGVNEDPSFKTEIQPIFIENCAVAGCHNSSAAAGLDLSENFAYHNLVDKPSQQAQDKKLVLPSNPDDSYLIIKLENRQTNGTAQMPLGATPLSIDEIKIIKNWISKGAKNN